MLTIKRRYSKTRPNRSATLFSMYVTYYCTAAMAIARVVAICRSNVARTLVYARAFACSVEAVCVALAIVRMLVTD